MQRATLLIPTRPGDATVENSRKHGAWLRDLAQGARHQVSDDIGGPGSFSGRDRGPGSVDGRENLSLGGTNHDAGLRSASVDANYDFTHSSDLHQSARSA